MEKQHVNPFMIKQKAMSDEGKAYINDLEQLNWELQEHQFEGYKKQLRYDIMALKYKKFLGYEVSDEEIETKEKELEEYDSAI